MVYRLDFVRAWRNGFRFLVLFRLSFRGFRFVVLFRVLRVDLPPHFRQSSLASSSDHSDSKSEGGGGRNGESEGGGGRNGESERGFKDRGEDGEPNVAMKPERGFNTGEDGRNSDCLRLSTIALISSVKSGWGVVQPNGLSA